MKILLFGKNGQVGWELQRALAPLGEVIAPGRDGAAPLNGDIGDPVSLAACVRAVAPDIIVNAAAHTAVDKAESEQALAHALNAQAPQVLAREASMLGAWLVHFSTDYVFDGSGTQPWSEDDPTGPLSAYGRSKLDGEQAILASGCKHLILRTSWVYAARGGNFAKTMVRLAKERTELNVIDDQFGSPTGAELLADVTAHALRVAAQRPEVSGIYHAAAQGETTWYRYACHVVAYARAAGVPLAVVREAIKPVATSAFPTPARRPANSRLNTAKLRHAFGLVLPAWQSGVERMLSEVLDLH